MGRRKISTTVYLEPDQATALRDLTSATFIPQAKFIRQGVDMVIKQRREELDKYRRARYPEGHRLHPGSSEQVEDET
jgi:hypothetical protein